MWYARTGLVIVAMLSAGAVGCHRQQVPAASASAPAASSSTVALVVDNENFENFDVFLVQGSGMRTRLGMVSGAGTTSYTLAPDLWAGGTVRVVAKPIGGFGTARSDPLTVFGGSTITFTIEPDVSASYATVR